MRKDKDKRNEYSREYKRKNEYHISPAFRYDRDADVIEYLKTVPNKTDFLCGLIRQHMKQQLDKQIED